MSVFSLRQWRLLLSLFLLMMALIGWRTAQGVHPWTERYVAAAIVGEERASEERALAQDDGQVLSDTRDSEESGEGAVAAGGPVADRCEACTGTEENRSAGGSQGVDDPSDVEGAGRVDINRADAATLQTLHGIGPVLAERIIRHRETWGPFDAPSDLMEVSGIGPRTFERLRDHIWVGPQ